MAVGIIDTIVSVTNNLTLNYTVSAGSNRRVVVFITTQNNAAQPNITSVTLDGQSATEDATVDETVANTQSGIWSILETDISTGAGLTCTIAGTNIDTSETSIGLVVLKDCEQVGPEDTDQIAAAAGTSVTRTLSVTAGALLLDCLQKRNVNDVTAGADQTEILDLGFSGEGAFTSHQSGGDGGVMSASWAGSVSNAYTVVSYATSAAFIPRTGGII